MQKRQPEFMTGALMLALLTGCGASGDTSGPETIRSPTLADASAIASSEKDATGAETDSTGIPAVLEGIDDETITRPEASGAQTKAVINNAWHLNSRGVSAELLAAMLLQNGNTAAAPLDRAGHHENAPTAPLLNAVNEVSAGGSQTHTVLARTWMWNDLFSNPDDNGWRQPRIDFPDFYTDNQTPRFTDISLAMPVKLNAAAHVAANHADGSPNLQPLPDLKAGTLILSVTAPLSATSQQKTGDRVFYGYTTYISKQEPHTVELASVLPGRLRSGQRIGYLRALQTWRDDRGNLVQLFAMPDNAYDRARLCLISTFAGQLRRLSCSIWQIPAQWRPGQPIRYAGHYLANRHLGSEASGNVNRQWTTLPPEPAIHSPVLASSATQPAAAAISQEGISGEVLATMLTQAGGGTDMRAWDSDGPIGKFLRVPIEHPLWGPEVDAYRNMGFSRRVAYAVPEYTPAFARSLTLIQGTAVDNAYVHPRPWLPHRTVDVALHLTANLGHFETDAEGRRTGFTLVNLHQAPTGTPIVSLANNAYVSLSLLKTSDSDNKYYPNSVALQPVGSTQVRKGALVAFDTPVQRWRSPEGTELTLSLRRGATERQVWLCQHLKRVPLVERRQCAIWNVPQNWYPGQPLSLAGAHATDNRTFASAGGELPPDTPRHLHWMGSAQ